MERLIKHTNKVPGKGILSLNFLVSTSESSFFSASFLPASQRLLYRQCAVDNRTEERPVSILFFPGSFLARITDGAQSLDSGLVDRETFCRFFTIFRLLPALQIRLASWQCVFYGETWYAGKEIVVKGGTVRADITGLDGYEYAAYDSCVSNHPSPVSGALCCVSNQPSLVALALDHSSAPSAFQLKDAP